MSLKILITGASGFVGTSLINQLLDDDRYQPIAVVRSSKMAIKPNNNRRILDDILPNSNWAEIIEGMDVIIHLAARVHIMNDKVDDPLAEFRKVNTDATLNLARQAAEAGVKRFVFLSSIKVNGEMTKEGHAFSPEDEFIPTDPYGLSKYEAEQGLLSLAKDTGMDVVIVRSPLVYGVGVKANFALMMRWVHKGRGLPFGRIKNQRSLVALDNLTSFIIHCIEHPKAVNEVFLISDGEDVSITALLKKIAKAFEKQVILIPVPVSLMIFTARIIGKSNVADRLFGSLQVDSSKAVKLLNWHPVISMDEQLKKIADEWGKNEKVV